MPKVEILVNQHISVEKGQEIDARQSTSDTPVIVEMWTLIFKDKTYHDEHRISFPKEVRDDIVKMLTGIVLPGI